MSYIKFDGLCFKPDNWTKLEYDLFIDKMCELAESFGAEVQLSCSYKLLTEEELEKEDDT